MNEVEFSTVDSVTLCCGDYDDDNGTDLVTIGSLDEDFIGMCHIFVF